MWSASLLLTQLSYAYEDLLSEMGEAKGTNRERVQRRMKEVKQQCLAVQAMIESTQAAD